MANTAKFTPFWMILKEITDIIAGGFALCQFGEAATVLSRIPCLAKFQVSVAHKRHFEIGKVEEKWYSCLFYAWRAGFRAGSAIAAQTCFTFLSWAAAGLTGIPPCALPDRSSFGFFYFQAR